MGFGKSDNDDHDDWMASVRAESQEKRERKIYPRTQEFLDKLHALSHDQLKAFVANICKRNTANVLYAQEFLAKGP